MAAASWIGWNQNEDKHNEDDKNKRVELKHSQKT